ncbi:MAG: phosphatidate cytidylyltransferase [Bacteroidetes bacterium]|nr:phosphatidate cytidylyltransferase [Bacteroidota bacterium]
MKQGYARIGTALVGLPLVLGVLWAGSWVFFALMLIVALLGQREMLNLVRRPGIDLPGWPALVVGGSVFLHLIHPSGWIAPIVGVCWLLAWSLRASVEDAVERIVGQLASVVYPVLMLSFLVDIRWTAEEQLSSPGGFTLTLMLFLLIWATDTGAYYTGKAMGKTPFAPTISPNKTWEGTVGGCTLAILVAIAFKVWWLPMLGWTDVVVLALVGGCWGQLGDLLESSLKRSAGVKDSGSFLPGHGGALDRFDSLIFSTPLYWIYLLHISPLLAV